MRGARIDCYNGAPNGTTPRGALDREEETMASSPIPTSELTLIINKFPDEAIVQCGGRITADTTEKLRDAVKPLLAESKFVVLDLKDVSYLDSSGLGTIVGLSVSAKVAGSQLKLIHLNERLKELFSLTRLGQFLTEGRDPEAILPP
jgi:anti-sigma B factor antagonist